MTRYILNSAVITAPGAYIYKLISIAEMKEWLQIAAWVSCIGYQETANALSSIAGLSIPVSRKTITMLPGDEALVFRLVFPAGYRPDPEKKGRLGLDFVLSNCEAGHLRRID